MYTCPRKFKEDMSRRDRTCADPGTFLTASLVFVLLPFADGPPLLRPTYVRRFPLPTDATL